MLLCSSCGRDIDEIWQDNVSRILGSPLCEDCDKTVNQDYLADDEDYLMDDYDDEGNKY